MTTATVQPKAGIDPQLRRLMLVVLTGAIMTILDTTIVNVAVNTLGRDFNTSLATIQWVLTGYTLALSMAIPVTGWAVQRYGAKTMWLISLTLFIAGSVLCGAAWSVGSLVVFRVLQGLGGGMILPVGQTMLAKAAGPDRMGRVMAVVAVPAMLGPVLGPMLGGLIVDNLDWRWMFYVNVPFCALALLLAIRLLPADTDHDPGTKLDLVGMLLLSPGLAALVYGLSEAGNGDGLTGAKFLTGAIVGTMLIVAFVIHALNKGDRALIDLRLFKERAFTTATSALFIYAGAIFGVMILLPLYFQTVRLDSSLRAGMMIAPLGLGAMVTMPIAGRLTDRTGSRGLALTGILIVLAGVLGYTQIDATTGTALMLAITFVVGLGHGMMMPSLMGGLYRGLAASAVPSATTAANILVRIGSSFGVAALAVVLQIAIRDEIPGVGGNLEAAATHRNSETPSLLSSAFGQSFWWALGIAALALIPILLIPRRKPVDS